MSELDDWKAEEFSGEIIRPAAPVSPRWVLVQAGAPGSIGMNVVYETEELTRDEWICFQALIARPSRAIPKLVALLREEENQRRQTRGAI